MMIVNSLYTLSNAYQICRVLRKTNFLNDNLFSTKKMRDSDRNIPPLTPLQKSLDRVNQIAAKTVPGWEPGKSKDLYGVKIID